uniref:CD177 antigen-like n=1 Tax=Phascolarctos cinereus TaxID=38626 RepID=A0A6P5LTG9_PHACI|nr:CD177 antigen-like [Phascolarctos cinereus]
MGPQLFWLLGAALALPCTEALVCKKGYLIHDDDRSAFPISWNVRITETCEAGEGCQETLIILESGNRVGAVISHGCTRAQAHEAKDIQHRAPPGVTIASFTKVCHSDLCNDLDNTLPLWTPEPTDAPAQGALQCPLCVSPFSCPSDAPLVPCPSGTTHCYSGTIQLSGGGLSHPLRVQGCVPHGGCQLLNGTETIGPISLTESCESEGSQDTRAQVCFTGHLSEIRDKSDLPISWTATYKETCKPGEGCQDTLILLESGDKVAIVLRKGCQRGRTQEPLHTWHRRPPGVTIISYTHVCHSDLCNNLSSSFPLWRSRPPTAAPAPDGFQCPTCVALGSSCLNPKLSVCPEGTSQCYQGVFRLSGGGIVTDLSIQGCATEAVTGCSLLGKTQAFGPIAVNETCRGKKFEDQSSPNRVSATTVQVWGMRVGLLLALWGCLPPRKLDHLGGDRNNLQLPCRPRLQDHGTTAVLAPWGSLALPCTGALTCYKGVSLSMGQNLRNEPEDLTTENTITCKAREVCQETVLFTESGTSGIILSSKGCIADGSTSSGPTTLASPGVTIISYTRVCSSDLCNDLSSTASILSPASPAAPAPGGFRCPTCVALGSSCSNPMLSVCPEGTSSCYQGLLSLSGGGISMNLGIQGCAPKAVTGCSLLGKTQAFGPIDVTEVC